MTGQGVLLCCFGKCKYLETRGWRLLLFAEWEVEGIVKHFVKIL